MKAALLRSIAFPCLDAAYCSKKFAEDNAFVLAEVEHAQKFGSMATWGNYQSISPSASLRQFGDSMQEIAIVPASCTIQWAGYLRPALIQKHANLTTGSLATTSNYMSADFFSLTQISTDQQVSSNF